MNLIRWNKHPVFPDIFDNMLWDNVYENWHKPSRTELPAYNISEKEDAFEVELAVPGISKKDLKIDLEKNLLTISSEKKAENEERENKRAFVYHAFTRSFTLPESVDAEKIQASCENGILSVLLPKKEKEKTGIKKTIKIS